MGEEVNMSDYGEDNRILDWELELTDLTPLSQSLIPPQLASAFNIKPELRRTVVDVNRASEETFSSLRRVDSAEEADSPLQGENSNSNSLDDQSARTLKKPRLVWTPQLHKRFVDVVSHLGIKNAVPKTIMQMMNVEGLTRENVASHLQKYRLYLKRMQGLSNEGPSSSDPLFASTPIPASLHESGRNGHMPMPVQMPMQMQYGQMMMHMPMFHHGHMGMAMGNHPNPYGMMQQYDTNATASDK